MKYFFLLFTLTLCISSCRMKNIPVEIARVDSIYFSAIHRDSIIVRDSIYIVEKGDTVYKTKFKYIYRDRIIHDTIFTQKCDTITKVVEVEKKSSIWQFCKFRFGEVVVFFTILLGFIVFKK